MASLLNSLICGGVALVIYICLGLPLMLRIAPRPLAIMLAPAIGWGVHSVLALPLFFLIGLSHYTVISAFVVSLFAALAALWQGRAWQGEAMLSRSTALALFVAALLAFVIMAAALPKISAGSVTLAGPIFDHSKVAMIDEMVRLGVPPGNPFFGGEGPARLSYYYLWHFSAAELALLLGISGWEADAGLSLFTGFASLAVLIGLAVALSGRASAGLWAVALAATGSMRTLINWFIDRDSAADIIAYQSGLGGWLFQTSWAPQHTASAMLAVVSIVLLVELGKRPGALVALLLALTMAAGFESSTWVGGVAFPLAAAPIALFLLLRAEASQRLRLLAALAIAALLALALMSPFLYDQLQLTGTRGGASPIAIEPAQILADDILDEFGGWLDWPAYWLLYLPVELPGFYIAGLVALVVFLKNRTRAPAYRPLVIAFALTIAVSLLASWLLVSTLGENNDLGWRAILPGVMLLVVFAAAALSRLTVKPLSGALAGAVALAAFGIPDTVKIAVANIGGTPSISDKHFAATPALWQAVWRVTPVADRVANNPLFMEKVTPWPVNISWALLADRRSCYAGPALAPFSALPKARQDEIAVQFDRVFSGQAAPGDIDQLAGQFKCDTAVVTPEDGAWTRDPFANSPRYRLVDGTAAWRIYRKN